MATPTRSQKKLCGEDQQTQTRKDRAFGKLSPILPTTISFKQLLPLGRFSVGLSYGLVHNDTDNVQEIAQK